MPIPQRPLTGPIFTDPHGEQVRVVNQAFFHGIFGGLCDITLCTLRMVPDPAGGATRESIVAARLRLDLVMAKSLRDGLARQIELAETPTVQPN